MTKKQLQMVNNYYNSTMHDIYDLYDRPSYYKIRAEQMILNEMLDNNGYDYRICGGNSCTFSCAYRMIKGNHEILVYHTAQNRYEIVLD